MVKNWKFFFFLWMQIFPDQLMRPKSLRWKTRSDWTNGQRWNQTYRVRSGRSRPADRFPGSASFSPQCSSNTHLKSVSPQQHSHWHGDKNLEQMFRWQTEASFTAWITEFSTACTHRRQQQEYCSSAVHLLLFLRRKEETSGDSDSDWQLSGAERPRPLGGASRCMLENNHFHCFWHHFYFNDSFSVRGHWTWDETGSNTVIMNREGVSGCQRDLELCFAYFLCSSVSLCGVYSVFVVILCVFVVFLCLLEVVLYLGVSPGPEPWTSWSVCWSFTHPHWNISAAVGWLWWNVAQTLMLPSGWTVINVLILLFFV